MKKIALFLVGLLIVSCSDNQVEKLKQLKTDPKSAGKQVELIGHIEMDFMSWNLTEGKETSAQFKVSNPMNDAQFESIPIKINYGKIKNSFFINLPEDAKEYTAADVIAYDNNGTEFKIGQKVKIKATMQTKPEQEETSNSIINMDTFKPTNDDSAEEKESKRKYLNNVVITLE